MADVTLQVRKNGGSVQTGHVTAAVGDTIQLTAANKTGWNVSTVRWELYDYPPDMTVPAGWTADADGIYYCLGSADPPSFAITHWGKVLPRVIAAHETDERTLVDVASPSGLKDMVRREGAQIGGNRLQWVHDQKANLRSLEKRAPLPANAFVYPPSGDTTGVTDRAAIQAALTAGRPVYLVPGGTYYRDVEFTGDLSLIRCIGGEATIVGVGSLDDIYVSDKIPLRASQRQVDRPPTGGLPRVILFRGQSNMMAGVHPTAGYSEISALLSAKILGWGHTAAAWVPVVDGACNSRVNHGTSFAGPGLGQLGTRIARTISDITGQTIRTYAVAYPGQPIDYFLPASATKHYFEDGSQHPTLNNYDYTKSIIDAGGYLPEWEIFCQGEANAGMTASEMQAKLETLWAASEVDYPGRKMLIIGTIGNADDRSAAGQPSCTGVRRGQRNFAAAHPGRVFFLDTTAMRGFTSLFDGLHYYQGAGSSAGYEELHRISVATMRGEDATVDARLLTQHPRSIFPFQHWWGHRHSLAGGGVVASWQDDIGTDSLIVENGTPEHVASDAGFGGRAVMRFDHTASERFTETSIAGGKNWVFQFGARLKKTAIDGNVRCVVQLETAGAGGNRIDISFGGSGQHTIGFNGSGYTFTGPSNCEGDVEHDYLVTYAGGAGPSTGVAKLYIDGVLVSTLTGLPTVDTGASARIRVGSFSGVAHFGGEIAYIGCAAEPASFPTDADVAAMHAGARTEWKLET